MGIFDHAVKCPACGAWGAKKSFFKVKCVNPVCAKFDAARAAEIQQNRVVGKSAQEVFPHLKGDAHPNDYSLRIRYQNFRGDELIYAAHPATAYKKGEFLVARLAPTGRHATFRLVRIQNRNEIDSAMTNAPQPAPNERRILHYHFKRGSTSRAFEALRQKYPNYTP